jgi:hypothetical protein
VDPLIGFSRVLPMSEFQLTDTELLGYLDEMLPLPRAAEIEQALRDSQSLRQRAALLVRRRDQGGHTVGEIWRRERLSCLSRSQLGSYLLGTLDSQLVDYIEFHLDSVGCRICAANLEDLRQASAAAGDDAERSQRSRRYFESSAGHLVKR